MNLWILWLAGLTMTAARELEERGRTHLYNLEYGEARTVFAELTRDAPFSPAGPYYEATTLWMGELTRRGGMAGSTFRTGRFWSEKRHEPPAPALDREFKGLVSEAIARARAILDRDPEERDALYFRGAAEGVLSAYLASIEHRYYRSYRAGKRAKRDHENLLKLQPSYADACLLPGIFEYTVATLPRTWKIAGFLFGLRGSREKGLALVERAVTEGTRSQWVAKLALSVLREREKKYRGSLALLGELETAFPRNPLLPLERGSVHMLRKDWRAARRAFEHVRAGREAERPNYGLVPPSLIRLRIAESYLFEKNYARAASELEAALGLPAVPERIKARVFLRRGMVEDAMGVRDAARWDYRRALRLDFDRLTNKLAKRYLRKPYR